MKTFGLQPLRPVALICVFMTTVCSITGLNICAMNPKTEDKDLRIFIKFHTELFCRVCNTIKQVF